MRYKRMCALLLTLALIGLGLPASAQTAEEAALGRIRTERMEETGASDSFVRYPLLSSSSAAQAPVTEQINEAIARHARIAEYLQALSMIGEGSVGLKMDYQQALPGDDPSPEGPVSRYASFLFSAEGKMLAGRPSQVYYPMTFDLLTGEEVSFEQLFADPDGAKDWIENCLADEIAPALSTYLENSELFPVPWERFFLDGFGNLILLYEHNQLSFLSGCSGAVAFRYSELWDFLDQTPDGVPMQILYRPEQYTGAAVALLKDIGALYSLGLGVELYPGEPLADALAAFRSSTDSEYYPGGACCEVEDARLRGTLILTDEEETAVTGILTGRVDLFGIMTGSTSLTEAEALLGASPQARLPIDEDLAEAYRVCPGTASVYPCQDGDGRDLSFTLYADVDGVVRFIRLAFDYD